MEFIVFGLTSCGWGVNLEHETLPKRLLVWSKTLMPGVDAKVRMDCKVCPGRCLRGEVWQMIVEMKHFVTWVVISLRICPFCSAAFSNAPIAPLCPFQISARMSPMASVILCLLTVVGASELPQDSKGACALQTKHTMDAKTRLNCDWTTEVMCHDPTTMTDSCYPMSTGCPVTCAAGEHLCFNPPSCQGCSGYSWCSTYTCPITCGINETMCHDSTTMTDSCHPKSAGCPVTCAAGEHVCHTPPYCDTCDGYNWCSAGPCPITCASDEIVCWDSATNTDSCHPMSSGCPVTCAAGENKCHSPPTCDTCYGYEWCSPSPCPITCGMDEIMCHDSTTMTDSCHPMSTGCPVTCAAGEHVCHSPPACETCSGYSWCSTYTCPVMCGADEIACWDSATNTESCHPMSSGCPVTCAAGENKCHSPPTCDTCSGYDWCSPSPCPVYCTVNETMCHDPTTMTDSCHPKSAGCPVTCAAGEHVCHTPPYCDTCDGYNWCSSSPCPIYCSMDEVMCHDSTTMTDSCHPKTTGCPVTCAAGEHVCHSPPPCATCEGYSWCSTATCPITCAADEIPCWDSTTQTESCHPSSTGCPVWRLAGWSEPTGDLSPLVAVRP